MKRTGYIPIFCGAAFGSRLVVEEEGDECIMYEKRQDVEDIYDNYEGFIATGVVTWEESDE